jgi:hypothetical protein
MASFGFNTSKGETMKKEDLSAQVDGNNTIFTVSQGFKADSLRVYWQGSRQTGQFTVLNSTQFQLNFAPILGTVIDVDYNPA